MGLAEYLIIGLFIFVAIFFLTPLIFLLYVFKIDSRQEEHAVLRNYPLLGRVRYFVEKIGPELRQYLFDHDTTGKPFSRTDYQNIVLPAKYKKRMLAFGSKRSFTQDGYFLNNAFFPKQMHELKIDQSPYISTKLYNIDQDNLFKRKEHREDQDIKPYYLTDDDAITIGPSCREPFQVKGLVGMSAMSYGALGDHAITALSKGLGLAGGTWMNTGEGGLSPYHLEGNVDLIMQIGPGLYGVRTEDGTFSWEELKKKSEIKHIRAFELKLGQGAKTRGGHVEGKKVTHEIASIRNVPPYQSIDSPNRFKEFHDFQSMLQFIDKMRTVTGKPIGIKLVVGNANEIENLVQTMKQCGISPDFITIDGSEGGTGATFQELADSVGLPLLTAIRTVDHLLYQYGLRQQLKLIASGKLITPDRVATALALGADLVNIARGFMITVGCIMANICHTNNCPVGVATTDPDLQKALVIEEKLYRTCNYLVSLREGLFNIAAAVGVDSPTKLSYEHITYHKANDEPVIRSQDSDIPFN